MMEHVRRYLMEKNAEAEALREKDREKSRARAQERARKEQLRAEMEREHADRRAELEASAERVSGGGRGGIASFAKILHACFFVHVALQYSILWCPKPPYVLHCFPITPSPQRTRLVRARAGPAAGPVPPAAPPLTCPSISAFGC